jgi:hypothetical protein
MSAAILEALELNVLPDCWLHAAIRNREIQMLDFLMSEKHAISILKKDHDAVKDLFERFEKATSSAGKERIIGKAITELKMHAVVEEEIFYPAVRKHVGAHLMNEADEEHHLAKVLIAELDQRGGGGEHREAKFTVLAESVRHHIKEEENEMMPKAKEVEIDFDALGQKILDRKKELKEDGIPKDAEHAMVAQARGKGVSPAAASRKKRTSLKTTRSNGRASQTPKNDRPHIGQ